jgi:A/G-specific adenine glycosylase
MSNTILQFRQLLLQWHKSIDRSLPWKNNNDPYKIWVSEIILQQTRVEQGIPYYLKFIEKYPTVKDLAKSDEDEILKSWEGLGYYTRARNLHAASKEVIERFNGKFPDKYEDVILLPGIGPYTASAILSFAYGQPYAVIDGNVKRVLSRVFGYAEPIDTAEGISFLKEKADQCLDKKSPGAYNQAIMDFGALQCVPQKPDCITCPMKNCCSAFLNKTIESIPHKSKKTKVRRRYFHYFYVQGNNMVYISQRGKNDIWARLFEFPLYESNQELDTVELCKNLHLSKSEPRPELLVKQDHKLSHQILTICIYKMDVLPIKTTFKNLKLEKVQELHKFAFPKPIYNFLFRSE